MPPTTALRRVELHALERTMTWRDDGCFKIVTTMLLHGSTAIINAFTHHLPQALLLAFNRHPRMRGRMAKDAFATLEIHPPFKLQDIHTNNLLYITDASQINDTNAWQAFIQQQCAKPFDRAHRFTFELHAWVDASAGAVRLFLFADHYNSDGASGNTILHDVLRFAGSLASPNSAINGAEELPLEPSLYTSMLASRKVAHPMIKGMMKSITKKVLKLAPQLDPIIQPRRGHQDLCIPPPLNPSTQLFATGSKQSLETLVKLCREHETSFFGVLTAAAIVATAFVADVAQDATLKLSLDASFNMRERATDPISSGAVGGYALSAPLVKLLHKGLHLPKRGFWDTARSATREARSSASNFAMMAIPMVALDQFYHAGNKASFWKGISVRHSSMADVNISSVGQYPHAMVHSFPEGPLKVASLHYSCRVPYLAALSQFYVTSVGDSESGHGIGYSLNHCYEDETGRKLLDAVVQLMEKGLPNVSASDSLADVVKLLQG